MLLKATRVSVVNIRYCSSRQDHKVLELNTNFVIIIQMSDELGM